MIWSIQLIIVVCIITFYIVIIIELHTDPSFLNRQLFYSLGIGVFSTLLIMFWILQYSIHHTILYWRIIKLFE